MLALLGGLRRLNCTCNLETQALHSLNLCSAVCSAQVMPFVPAQATVLPLLLPYFVVPVPAFVSPAVVSTTAVILITVFLAAQTPSLEDNHL